MSHPPTPLAAARARFCAIYLAHARFKEDRALVEALAAEVEPVLEALAIALQPGEPALHEPYALLTLLARLSASLGATPGVPLAIVDAIVAGCAELGVAVDPARREELALVTLEGYCAARDERSTRLLRSNAAESQIAVELGPRCVGIFLAGSHDEADLGPALERFARDLLHADTASCLLDVSRLSPIDEELARALGRFCTQAATLGVCTFVTGAPESLQLQFVRWSVTGGATMLVDAYTRARSLALAAAGLELGSVRRWPRWFLPARRSLMR